MREQHITNTQYGGHPPGGGGRASETIVLWYRNLVKFEFIGFGICHTIRKDKKLPSPDLAASGGKRVVGANTPPVKFDYTTGSESLCDVLSGVGQIAEQVEEEQSVSPIIFPIPPSFLV